MDGEEARRRRQGVVLVIGTAVIGGVSICINSLALVGISAPVFTGLKNL
ncbi:MAG: hypothetical protein ACE5JE_03560 [Thermoplasmata archaeon]